MEYLPVFLVLSILQIVPLRVGYFISCFLGDLIYFLVPKRRKLAVENLSHAFPYVKSQQKIKKIARQSCRSYMLSLFEGIKLRSLVKAPDGMERLRKETVESEPLLRKAKEIHETSGGCIFVTPHIGNYEFLPFTSFIAGIPQVIIVRPLDNQFLEDLLYSHRAASGQVILAKKNSMHLLQRALRQGKSVCMLPDQSTMTAVSVDYFGREAATTPVPALLAVLYKRPIVVVACCRKSRDFQYEGFVGDPIWPDGDKNEKTEIIRLTQEMNRGMEAIIRKYPEQYLWMHDRWKKYRFKKGLSL